MELINLFKQLVAIDSVSGEEQKISNFVFQYLKKLSLRPIRDKNNNIYCRIGKSKSKSLFCAHMDTVEPGRNIKVIERNGFLQSNGKTILGGDNKVAVAAILQSLKELKDENLNLELLFTVKEETDSGIQLFNYNLIEAKTGFVFDISRGDLGIVVLNAPSIYDFQFEFFGKEAHASRPEKGINVLSFLMNLNKKIKLGRLDKKTTFNIGIFSGGIATNTVPGNLILKGDLRSLNIKKFFIYKNKIEKIIINQANKFNIKTFIKWLPYCDGYSIKRNDLIFLKVKKIYKSLDIDLKPISTNGGSDANFLNKVGIKTFCLGDGVYDPHTLNERIKISDFFKLKEIVKNLMLKY